ncbi:MAG: T9SS type A sorting domain-containing protein [Flavobacteriales bacterium]
MRQSLFLASFCFSLISFAQNGPISFEPGEFGLTWTWTVFENVGNPPLEIVGNPDQTGINTSSRAAKFTALQGGMPYAGVECAHAIDLGTFTLNPSNCVVKIMVYKPIISNVGIKFATGAGASTGELLVANTLINQWEELTFDFTPILGLPSSSGIDQVIIFPDFQNRSSTNVCYFDNITFGLQGPPLATPLTPASDPNFLANDVISMFSNVYADVPVNTWQTAWSQGTLNDIQIQGNHTKKYSALNFVGVETTGPNILNVSAMTHLYMNVWTPNMTEFRVKLVDFGNDLSYAGGDDSEHEIAVTPNLENWLTLDIPLDDFVNLASKNHIAQLIFSGNPSGNGVVYVDNVLFHQAVTSVEVLKENNFLFYPNPTKDELFFTDSNEIQFIQIFSMSGKCEINELNNHKEKLDISSLENGMYLIQFLTTDGTAHQQKIVKE